MAYVINKTDGTVFLIVQDSQIATTAGITMVGKNYAGYGEVVNENFVRIVENFASTTPPANPVVGQTWFDTINGQLKVYDNNSAWAIPIGASGPIGYAGSQGVIGYTGSEGPTGPIGPSGVSSFPADAVGQLTNDGAGTYTWTKTTGNLSFNNDVVTSPVTGDIQFGTAMSMANVVVSGDIIPSSDVTYDLGSPTNQWKDLYLSATTMYMGGNPVSITNSGIKSFTEYGTYEMVGKIDVSDNTFIQVPSWATGLDLRNALRSVKNGDKIYLNIAYDLSGSVSPSVWYETSVIGGYNYSNANITVQVDSLTTNDIPLNNLNGFHGFENLPIASVRIADSTAATDGGVTVGNVIMSVDADGKMALFNEYSIDNGDFTAPTSILSAGNGLFYANNAVQIQSATSSLYSALGNIAANPNRSVQLYDGLTMPDGWISAKVLDTFGWYEGNDTWNFQIDGTYSGNIDISKIRLATVEDNSSLTSSGGLSNITLVSQAPSTSVGSSGDTTGMFYMDGAYIYYCVLPYDGVTNIWKRMQWASDTW